MKFIIVGFGSIGKKHWQNLLSCGITTDNIITVDPNPKTKSNYPDLKTALENEKNIQAGFICSPTNLHIPHSITLAKQGIHLFIEKPLSDNLEMVEELEKIVSQKKLVSMMGMCYRFHPALIIINKLLKENKIGPVFTFHSLAGTYLPDWHPEENYRQSYATQKTSGGGVILSMIHSLDYIRWLFGEIDEVSCFADKISALELDTEDFALINTKLINGIYGHIYLDFFSRKTYHTLAITGEDGRIFWDFFTHRVVIFQNRRQKILNYQFSLNDMYFAEMKYFLDCLFRKKAPRPNIIEGIKTLKFAITALASIRLKKVLKVND